MPMLSDAPAKAGERTLAAALILIALVVSIVGSLGAPLITAVAAQFKVPLAASQWTLTAPLLVGAIATPVLGRMGAGPYRRQAILLSLLVSTLGSALTVLSASFAWLIVGRVAQGVSLGLVPLTMAAAREHLSAGRSPGTIARLSVATTIGVGVGYPLAGLLAQIGGLRAAYGLGFAMMTAALIAGWLTVPASPADRSSRTDYLGVLLLSLALLLLLLGLGQSAILLARPALAAGMFALAALLLALWARHELRCPAPLVDLALLRRPGVAAANLLMLIGGVGMYLLLTLVTRFVQTPQAAGYGFGLDVFRAGLVLIPFSVFGFVGGRAARDLIRRFTPFAVLAIGSLVAMAAMLLFALARSQLWLPYATMALLGLGIATFSAAMPAALLADIPLQETSSALSFNQVLRSVGFSVGSAVGGLTLAAYTGSASPFPVNAGYTVAALLGAGGMLATAIIAFAGHVLLGRRPVETGKP